MSTSGPVIECVGVSKAYEGTIAVADATLRVEAGEIVSVLGASGCGKTTLLRLIAGFEQVDSGAITLGGEVVSSPNSSTPPERRRVGMVFQDYALFPHLTVAANIGFGLDGMSRPDKFARVEETLELVGLSDLGHRYPHELSGGQQQRVAVGRTLAPRPVAVLLDEPFSNLDAGMRSGVSGLVEEILRGRGVATVIVTHDREEAFSMADRVAVMNEGRIEQVDAPGAIFRSPATPFVARITGTSDFIPGQVVEGRVVTEIGRLRWAEPGPGPAQGSARTGGDNRSGEGDAVEVLVRPDDFIVLPNPGGASKILAREYRGDAVILVVGLASGASLRCRQGPYSDLPVGTAVDLAPSRTVPFVVFDSELNGSGIQ
jgi:iron(III) transport system ATP-binding protein